MKKLKLSTNAFQGNALNREQLKKVLGGVQGSSDKCPASCVAGLNDGSGSIKSGYCKMGKPIGRLSAICERSIIGGNGC